MELGNDLAGIAMERDYFGIWIFPIGLEVFTMDTMVEVVFILTPIEFNFSIKKNNTMFRMFK